MHGPKSAEEFIHLLDEAIFELKDALACAGDEGDGMVEFTSNVPLYDQLLEECVELKARFSADQLAVGSGKDLPFMPLVHRDSEQIPFSDLLDLINQGYKNGFNNN
jgi:hypothetical protein